ncbi:hypothetical protein MTR67_022203 [Solanum verrucosum]|uniref:Uncharacterized protein n=1 Tax=Solanum verrucosum TaxID=315347 RepID=A0AAF0QUW7_SOLVR|nr:hypothetical protein MTR67_022203 [Solanum verrucosum]
MAGVSILQPQDVLKHHRGQVLKVVKENKGEDLVLSTTDMVAKHTRIAEFYAGWGFSSSPPPMMQNESG